MKTIVAMGDTHGRHHDLRVPEGDVLIHAGDVCRYGSRENVDEFAEWFAGFPHRWKIVIAGNHDIALEKYFGYSQVYGDHGITYLSDTWTLLKGGPMVYGSPWTPSFGEWAFMLPEEKLREKFALIPDDVDVLVTHGPPLGVLDFTLLEGLAAGSRELALRIGELLTNRERPLVHLFGHIHEGHGSFETESGNYRAYNVSICDFKYRPVNPCTVIVT